VRPLAWLAIVAALVAGRSPAAPPVAAPFADWAWVVVSGDDEAAHEDEFTAAFDNARRDVVQRLEQEGFSSTRLAQLSADPNQHVERAGEQAVFARLAQLARTAPGGCLLYLTSHGSPDGVLVGEGIVSPRAFARRLRSACGARPTAVVISACYSGVFLPALEGPERFVLTAARRDRSSFGCGEGDRYPFFDGCVLQTFPDVPDFAGLAERTRRCVAERERAEGMSPPSEPQLFIGPDFRARTPPFPRPAP
jgi:hypothetical protein